MPASQLLELLSSYYTAVLGEDSSFPQMQKEWESYRALLSQEPLDYEKIFGHLTRLQHNLKSKSPEKSRPSPNLKVEIEKEKKAVNSVKKIPNSAETFGERPLSASKGNGDAPKDLTTIKVGYEDKPNTFIDVSKMLEKTKSLRTLIYSNARDLVKIAATFDAVEGSPAHYEPRTPLRKIAVYAKPSNQKDVYKIIERAATTTLERAATNVNLGDDATQTVWHL